jgi:Trypsin-like peptidase domain
MEGNAIRVTKQSVHQKRPAARTAASAESNPSPRRTRQSVNKANTAVVHTLISSATHTPAASSVITPQPNPLASSTSIRILPSILNSESAELTKAELTLLNTKQYQLRHSKTQSWLESSAGKEKLASAARAALVFAQEEAGTAVCISSSGLLLTCSHCVAETPEELDQAGSKRKWLLFASGQVVLAECVAWDSRRDLALLQVTAAQPEPQSANPQTLPAFNNTASASILSFPFVTLAEVPPRLRAALVCIGHPGSEDLEVTQSGVKTGYDTLHVSTGVFRGYVPDQDLHDNSEIGALKHDCWTYWGHSGAPLVEQSTSHLIGLHSSWDEKTGMRHGVPLGAIRQFLQQYAPVLKSE